MNVCAPKIHIYLKSWYIKLYLKQLKTNCFVVIINKLNYTLQAHYIPISNLFYVTVLKSLSGITLLGTY